MSNALQRWVSYFLSSSPEELTISSEKRLRRNNFFITRYAVHEEILYLKVSYYDQPAVVASLERSTGEHIFEPKSATLTYRGMSQLVLPTLLRPKRRAAHGEWGRVLR